jgi:hypothetical protein
VSGTPAFARRRPFWRDSSELITGLLPMGSKIEWEPVVIDEGSAL